MFLVQYRHILITCGVNPRNLCRRSQYNGPRTLPRHLRYPHDTLETLVSAGKTSLVKSRSLLTSCNVKFMRSSRHNIFLLGKNLSGEAARPSLDLIQTGHLNLGLSSPASCEDLISEIPKLTSLFAVFPPAAPVIVSCV